MSEDASSKLLRRSQRRIPARNALGSLSYPVAIGIAAALGLLATIGGFVLQAPIERAIVLGYARSATGLRIDAAGVERIDGGYEFTNASLSTRGGGVSLFAPVADVVVSGHDARIVVTEPHIALAPARIRGDEAATTRDALAHSSYDGTISISLRDGTALILDGQVPEPALSFGGLNGSLVFAGERLTYRAAATLDDDGRSYPITAQADAAPDGSVTNELRAAVIPLGPAASMLPSGADVRLLDGTLRDVDLRDGAELSATMRVDGLAAQLGAHALRGLSGPVVFAAGGVGSKGLAGTIDGVPVTIAGEVHDLGPHFAFVTSGSNDLSHLANLAEQLAAEPAVTSIALEAEAPGLAYGQYAMTTDHGPLAVSLLAIDPREPTLRFDTAIAEDRVISGGERTSSMGLRTGAVGGMNGDYFDIGRTYQPQGMLVRSGELIRGPVKRAALAIDKSNHVRFGEFELAGSARIGARTFAITQLNDWPAGKVTIITPAFGKQLPAEAGATFVRLEPLDAGGGHFRVASVETTDAPLPVSLGLAFGPDEHAVVKAGERVDLHYDTVPSTRDAVAAIGGGPILVKDGEPYDDPDAPAPDEKNYRWPVDALAETNAGTLMLVAVDGRHPERSIGMMRPDFSDLLIRLGARNAMALDSGGSVTLVSRAVGSANVSVRNVPSDNSLERWVSDAIFVYSSAPAPTIVPPTDAPTPIPEARPSP